MSKTTEHRKGIVIYEKVKDNMLFGVGNSFGEKEMDHAQSDLTTIRQEVSSPKEFFDCLIHYLHDRPSLVEWHVKQKDLPKEADSEKKKHLSCAKMYTDMTIALEEVWGNLDRAGIPRMDGIEASVVKMNFEHVAIGIQVDKTKVPKKWLKVLEKVMNDGPDEHTNEKGWNVEKMTEEQLLSRFGSSGNMQEMFSSVESNIRDLIKTIGKDKIIAKMTNDLVEAIENIESGTNSKKDIIEATFEDLEVDSIMPNEIPEA
jgi:hypothetical protein